MATLMKVPDARYLLWLDRKRGMTQDDPDLVRLSRFGFVVKTPAGWLVTALGLQRAQKAIDDYTSQGLGERYRDRQEDKQPKQEKQ